MSDGASNQRLRQIALLLAYSLFIAFGTAAMLIIQHRPIDARGQMMIGIMAAGALIGGLLTLLFRKKLSVRRKFWRFVLVFLFTVLATLAVQGILTGGQFYTASFLPHDPLTTVDGVKELFFTSASGFAYFYVFGLDPFWPVIAAAATLFTLGFLTLHAEDDTTY